MTVRLVGFRITEFVQDQGECGLTLRIVGIDGSEILINTTKRERALLENVLRGVE